MLRFHRVYMSAMYCTWNGIQTKHAVVSGTNVNGRYYYGSNRRHCRYPLEQRTVNLRYCWSLKWKIKVESLIEPTLPRWQALLTFLLSIDYVDCMTSFPPRPGHWHHAWPSIERHSKHLQGGRIQDIQQQGARPPSWSSLWPSGEDPRSTYIGC